MPNTVSTTQPGPSGVTRPAVSTTRSPAAEVHSTAMEVDPPAVEVDSTTMDVDSTTMDVDPPVAIQLPSTSLPRPLSEIKHEVIEFFEPPGQLPIVKMMTKKNFPLLMCPEDDLYNPILLESIQFYHGHTVDKFAVPLNIRLNATYCSYHRKTVKWMVDLERRNSINDQSQFTAGILVDVFDEDKRLEMISCIVANASPTIIFRQKVLLDGRSEELKSDFPIPLHSKCIMSKINKTFYYGPKIFNTLIKDRSQNIIQRLSNRLYLSKRNLGSEDNLACYCNNKRSKSSLLICEMCGEAQHKKCVEYDPRAEGGLPYLCSSCWTFNDPIQCRATLIVVPDNCLELWNQDIKRIVSPALKCFVYNGIQSCNFMQPTIFNKYDVVLISYSKIAKELKYGQHYVDENQTTTGLRCYKKYPQSPLLCINWWRICLDQPQSYNNNIDKVLTIVSPLRSGHKWILPGTLIQDSSKNFFSIVKYLNLLGDKFDDMNFIRALKEKTKVLIIWISTFVWSNLMKNINSELNSPTPIHEIHWLSFPAIENYFYKNAERFYTSYILKNRKSSALTSKLIDVDRDAKIDIVGAILVLQEACVIPLIRGNKYMLHINGTFGLRHSLKDRRIKYRDECSQLLLQCIEYLKNVAEVYTFLDATKHYFDCFITDLINLLNNFYVKGPLSVETDYKIIEMAFKFKYLLKTNSTVTLRFPDDTLAYLEATIIEMEAHILNVHSNHILHDRLTLKQKLLETGDKTIEIDSLKHNYWWIKMLDGISSPLDFLTEVKTTIDCNRKAWIPNIVNQLKLKSLGDVKITLTNWLTDTITTRSILLLTFKTLDRNFIRNKIKFGCNKAICSISNKCLFCQFEDKLHHYKKLLINHNIENLDENIITNLSDGDREKTVSQYEILLRSLILCEKNNSVTDNYIKIATEHMEILNILSSEFLHIWKLWLSIDKYKKACEKIIKVKSKPKIDDVLARYKISRRSIKKKKMNDNDDSESVYISKLLNKHLPWLNSKNKYYFERLKTRHKSLSVSWTTDTISDSSSTLYLCSACNVEMNEHVLLKCGHCICSNCFIEACDETYMLSLSCPGCGMVHSMTNMERIKEGHEFGIQLKGSYCIKLESIISKLKEVIEVDECSKVIIFSSFKSSLDCLSSALSLNSINFMKIDLGCLNSTTVVNTFQNSENMSTILINLNIGLNNLKLNFVTRIFFMEPIMDKAFENRIIDQICSKQIKQTYVHHFIIKDSIDEKISKTFTNDDPSLGTDLTLGQLSELLINETDSQTD